ncbi:MAG: Uma2 family endonuclease [Chitinophagaceae bacterium]|nr:Uma2 family endonuclease [Chitinophagaceae bacterium]
MGNVITRPPRTMTEVYQSLPEGTLAQLINNQLVMSPAPTTPHQRILGKIYSHLLQTAEARRLGEVFMAPVDVFLGNKNIFQPDILFVATQNGHLVKESGVHGAPDIVIEVLSPSTWHYDYGEKKDAYERCGVKEYWLADPATKNAEGFALENKEFISLGTMQGKIKLRLIKTTIKF